jgi:hypothetical protein
MKSGAYVETTGNFYVFSKDVYNESILPKYNQIKHVSTTHNLNKFQKELYDLYIITIQKIKQSSTLLFFTVYKLRNDDLHAFVYGYEKIKKNELIRKAEELRIQKIENEKKAFNRSVEVEELNPKTFIQNSLEGKKIVVTGTLIHFTRESIKNTIMDLGGKIQSNISSETDFLIKGFENTGTKLDKAIENKIKILSEEDFLALITKEKSILKDHKDNKLKGEKMKKLKLSTNTSVITYSIYLIKNNVIKDLELNLTEVENFDDAQVTIQSYENILLKHDFYIGAKLVQTPTQIVQSVVPEAMTN